MTAPMDRERIDKFWSKAQIGDLKEMLSEMASTLNALRDANRAKDELTEALMADIEQLKKDKLKLSNNIRILQLIDPSMVFNY